MLDFRLLVINYKFPKFIWSDQIRHSHPGQTARGLCACSVRRVELSTTATTTERGMGLKHLVSLRQRPGDELESLCSYRLIRLLGTVSCVCVYSSSTSHMAAGVRSCV